MAQQADGTVYINSSIDTDGFTAGGKEIEAAARRAAKTVKGIGDAARIALERQTAAFVKSNQLYAQQEQKVQDLQNKLEEMAGQTVETTAFKEIQKQIDTDTAKLNRLIQTQEEFLQTGGKTSSTAYQRRLMQIDELRNSIEYAKAEQDELLQSGQAYQPVDTSAVTDKLIAEQQRLQQMGEALNVSYDSLKSKVEQYGGTIAGAAQKHGLLRKALSSVAGAAKKASEAILTLHKNTKKSNGSIGSGIKNMLKYTLGISSLLVLFRKIKSAIKDGMQNLAQYSGKINMHLSALKSSMTQLKNSLATAFNPILTVIEPILTRFINLLSQVITYVGMFFAALTGKKTFTKAVEVQEDYAESLGKTANNAKKAQKYISGLDEARTYTSDDDFSAGFGSVDPSQMFAQVEIPSFVNDWVKKFKEAWENADFSDFGTLVGTKLKNALDSIPWEEIKENAKRLGGSLATLINGFIETPGLSESIGETIGEAINTGVAGAKAFLSTTKFYELGQSVADTLNSAMETTDWGEAAETISLGIEGALDTAIGFLEGFSWVELADSIGDFLYNVDWGGIAGRLGLLLLEALRGAVVFVNRTGQNISSLLADFFRGIGWDSVAGFFEGLTEKIRNQGAALNYAFQMVIDWVKEKLGIHSPSTVFAEIGRYVIQGFINGFTSLFESVKNKFNTIKNNIVNIFTNLKTSISNIWQNGILATIKNSVNSIIGFINRMISGVVSGINSMISALNGLKFDVPDWVPAIGGKSFGFNIPTITAPQIPYLATGAVIPPNAPFMAVLGDQKHGTNVEAPLSTIEDAVVNAMSKIGGGFNGTIRVPVYINGRQVMEAVVEAAKLQQTVSGNNPLAFT